MLPVGTATGKAVRFMQEGMGEIVTIDLTKRDWDVGNAELREQKFVETIGEPVDDWWSVHAQWFINEERNAAALCIYRYKTPRNLKDWAERVPVAA